MLAFDRFTAPGDRLAGCWLFGQSSRWDPPAIARSASDVAGCVDMPVSHATWPPSDELLAWRPAAKSPTDSVWVSATANEGEDPPSWVPLPPDADADDYDELEIPAYALAHIETDAG